jgi:CheY-like chemotaxis protein
MHGGTVRAESEGPGRGSVFSVSLPIADPGTLPASKPADDVLAPSTRRRILVVEDEPDVRNGMADLLRIAGHEVEAAGDGAAALATCDEFGPDLVLLDIGLPGMDGYEVGRRLREILGDRARIVAVTGYGQEEDRLRAAAVGIDEHLVKPIRPEAIARLLRRPEESSGGGGSTEPL